jgi:hypothetical protein
LDTEIQVVLERKVDGGPTYFHDELGTHDDDPADSEEKGAAPAVTENVETI